MLVARAIAPAVGLSSEVGVGAVSGATVLQPIRNMISPNKAMNLIAVECGNIKKLYRRDFPSIANAGKYSRRLAEQLR
jgi:hypothetical protein